MTMMVVRDDDYENEDGDPEDDHDDISENEDGDNNDDHDD